LGLKTGASNDKTLAQAAEKRNRSQAFSGKEENPFFQSRILKRFLQGYLGLYIRGKRFFCGKQSQRDQLFTLRVILLWNFRLLVRGIGYSLKRDFLSTSGLLRDLSDYQNFLKKLLLI